MVSLRRDVVEVRMNKEGTGWWLESIGRVPLLTPAQEIELGIRVQTWLHHEDGPDDCPPSIRRSGKRAKDQFVAANLRLAVSYVSKHCSRLISQNSSVHDDLIQSANLGVIRAVEKFDPKRGYRFSTYAYWWIRQSVNRWIDLSSRTISIPGSHSQMLSRIGIARRRLSAELMRSPTNDELSEDVGLTLEQFNALALRARTPLSLDQPTREDDSDLQTYIGTDGYDLEQADQNADDMEQIFNLLDVLQPQQRRIVSALHGIMEDELTLGQVAKQERISAKRAKLIYQSALNLMQRYHSGQWTPSRAINMKSSTPITPILFGEQLRLFDIA